MNSAAINFYSNLNYCSGLLSGVKQSFYEQSLFFALNNQEIKDKSHQYKDLSWTQKFKIGVIKGVESQLVNYFFSEGLTAVLSGMPTGKEASSELPSLLEAVGYAIVEEVAFRGVLQNCLAGTQKIATYVTPQSLQENRVFKWLTSPSARILSINALFAVVHLTNSGEYLSTKDSLIQACGIMFLPMEATVHETTGNIIAPIASHMTYNFLGVVLNKLYS